MSQKYQQLIFAQNRSYGLLLLHGSMDIETIKCDLNVSIERIM